MHLPTASKEKTKQENISGVFCWMLSPDWLVKAFRDVLFLVSLGTMSISLTSTTPTQTLQTSVLLRTPELTLNWPDMMVSVMLRLLSDSPKDWREEEEDVLEVSEGGRAVLMGVAVGVALPLDLRRSFSAFRASISFCTMTKEWKRLSNSLTVISCISTGHCCYSESVLLELWAVSRILIFKDLFELNCKSQIRSLTWSPDLNGDYRLLQTRQSKSTKTHSMETVIVFFECVPLLRIGNDAAPLNIILWTDVWRLIAIHE